MKMEFIIDDEKCKKEGFEKADCYIVIRKHFDKWNKNGTIKEIQEGIFVGEEDDINAFGSTFSLTDTNWFLKVIKEWYWYNEDEKEDCLKSYYRTVMKSNKV